MESTIFIECFNNASDLYLAGQVNEALLECDRAILSTQNPQQIKLAMALKLGMLCCKIVFLKEGTPVDQKILEQLAIELKILPRYTLFKSPYADTMEFTHFEEFKNVFDKIMKKVVWIQEKTEELIQW